MKPKQPNILVGDTIRLPNGRTVRTFDFISEWRSLRRTQGTPPRKGGGSSCTLADLFSDRFDACTGMIDGSSPGPVCGWTFITPFGPLGGEFNFTPGSMSMDTDTDTEYAIAWKTLPAAFASFFDISGQFTFTEYLSTPNGFTTYQIVANNVDISESLSVSFFGDGSLGILVGDSTLTPFYVGTWTPTPGATHTVSFSIDALGIPTLYVDGVEISLTLFGSVSSFFTLYPANMLSWGGGSGDPAAGSSVLESMFLTSG